MFVPVGVLSAMRTQMLPTSDVTNTYTSRRKMIRNFRVMCAMFCGHRKAAAMMLATAAAAFILPRTANHSASFPQEHQFKRAHLLHSPKSFPIHSYGWASGSGLLTFLFCYIILFFIRFIRTVLSRIAMYNERRTARLYICVCGRHGHRNESIYSLLSFF